MKKGIILALFLACTLSSIAQQQSDELCTAYDRIVLDARLTTGPESGNISPQTISLRLGYKPLPRLGVYANFEGTLGLCNDVKGFGSYYGSNSIGGGLSYRFVEQRDAFMPLFRTVEVHAAFGTTVGSRAWKYTLYEAGVSAAPWRINAPLFGIGYRVLDSRSTAVKTHRGLFISLGFRL